MVTTPDTDLLTAAVIGVLETIGRPVGDAASPAGAPVDLAPYVVLYPMWRRNPDGPVDDPEADTEYVYQLTCVGRDRQGAQVMRDQCRATLTRESLTVSGTEIAAVWWDSGSGDVTRDDDLDPPLFYCTDRFVLSTTPGPEVGS